MSKRPDKSGNCKQCGTWRKVLCRDHIIPRRDGGTDTISNIQYLCANCHQDKTALEQSAAHKGRPKSPEQKAKMSAWQIGVPKPQAVRDKISATLRGKRASLETKLKMSLARQGRLVSSETREKIRQALKGRVRRGETCPHGHVYNEKNAWVNKDGVAVCRACRRERRMKSNLTETLEHRQNRLRLKRESYHRHGETNRARMRTRYKILCKGLALVREHIQEGV